MNFENISTPETDRHEMCVKHTHRLLLDEDKVVESDKVRDLERRLAVARDAIKAMLDDLRLRGELCEDGVTELNISNSVLLQAEEALTVTAPKP